MTERIRKRGDKTSAGRTGPVTPAAVIDAALVVIDEEGLDALTMRRLAHDLGVEPVTIYRQLPNKDAILAGVAEKLWREMAPPEGAGGALAGGRRRRLSPPAPRDWREQVRGAWLALNGLMQRHPNAIPIIARGGSFSATAGEGTLGMLLLFKQAGLTPEEAAELLHILSACVVGFGFATLWGRQVSAAQEAAAAAGEPAPPPPDLGDLAEYAEAIAELGPGAVRNRPGHRARRLRRPRRELTARKSAGARRRLLLHGHERDAEPVLEVLETVDLAGVHGRRVHLVAGEGEDRGPQVLLERSDLRDLALVELGGEAAQHGMAPWCAGGP